MDVSMEEVIKNIIHIDKNAAELKRNFDKELEERKKKVKEEIEHLRVQIVESELKKIKNKEKEEEEKALVDAEAIKAQSYKICEEMQRKFEKQKCELVKEIFNHIFMQSA
ncbi:hypothetical protein FDN13_04560 [Caloramator sp. E03]|uniref:hypothetical protein n=1 Tax=Caloramator sp. E03 TaxID=2576307 RepID=UPI001110D42A|nr:hypothetical protein [Caloramator sp. E03]QCX33040.1 hypothetical protein FDN13_04560 [Caloramator sp. E03]